MSGAPKAITVGGPQCQLHMSRRSLAVLDTIAIEGPIRTKDVAELLGLQSVELHHSMQNLTALAYIESPKEHDGEKGFLWTATGKRPRGAPDPVSDCADRRAAAHAKGKAQGRHEASVPKDCTPAPAPAPAPSRFAAPQFWFSAIASGPVRRPGSMDFSQVPSRTSFKTPGQAPA
jgi:hypothetical protein